MIPTDCLIHKIPLPRALPPVLGVGAYLKNALCLIQEGEARISRENGSLDCVQALTRFQETAQGIIESARIAPIAVAHDWHPDFPSTRWAMECGITPIGIQHHHAHVAAVMAEHGTEAPTLGLALDGFGLGEDGAAWGGELLRVDGHGFTRLGHLRPIPQPGGDVAARQPWRMGAAALWALGRGAEIADFYRGHVGADMMAMMMAQGLNAPMTSSAGRLFDAACGLLGVLPVASFEGEAPMKLEGMVTAATVDPLGWRLDGLVLDTRPLLNTLIGMEPVSGANIFHGTLAAALLDWVERAVHKTSVTQVALCGGCFFNKVLRDQLVQGMIAKGITPLLPKLLSVGDPAIALGQAYAAALGMIDS